MTKANTTPRAMIGGIPVFCAYDEIIPVAKAVPNPQNPNQHPDRQINLLAEIIKQQGWRAPITISTRSGYIVRGHGRLMAARLLGADSVPVDFQNYESDAAEKADMIADNRISEFSALNDDVLAELLAEISESDLDIELAGFDLEELDQFLDLDIGGEPSYNPPAAAQQQSTGAPAQQYSPENTHEAPQGTFPSQEDYYSAPYEDNFQRQQGQTGEINLNDYSEDKYQHECPKCKFKW